MEIFPFFFFFYFNKSHFTNYLASIWQSFKVSLLSSTTSVESDRSSRQSCDSLYQLTFPFPGYQCYSRSWRGKTEAGTLGTSYPAFTSLHLTETPSVMQHITEREILHDETGTVGYWCVRPVIDVLDVIRGKFWHSFVFSSMKDWKLIILYITKRRFCTSWYWILRFGAADIYFHGPVPCKATMTLGKGEPSVKAQ